MFKGNMWTGLATILAGIFLVLVIVTTLLNFQNRTLQANLNQRQQYINQSMQLSQVYQLLVRSLATASVNNAGIKQLLASVGLNVTYHPNVQPAPASPTTTPVTPSKPADSRK